ncbi:cyclic GMP-AMP synthase-like receptor 3 [Saccoglossus kowalevskii]
MASYSEFLPEARTSGLSYKLNRITQDHVKVSCDEMERNKKTVCHIVDKVIEHMQKDATFQFSFDRKLGVGSSHENLKVREADEFDYNICLKIPDGWRGQIEGPGRSGPQGYAKYKLVGVSSSTSLVHRKWQSFMDHSHYLLPFKLYDWFYGLVAKALASELRHCPEIQGVTLRKIGPSANLIIINKPGRREIDMMRQIHDVMRQSGMWQISTKQYTGASSGGNGLWWRISTSPVEKYVLSSIDKYSGGDSRGGCRKQVLRLLKLLREVEGSNWLAIKSYHLKHLMMSESCRHGDWSAGKVDVRFIGCLRALQKCLRERKLQNVFFPKMNMFADLSAFTANDLAGRVKRIADTIERDSEKIVEYLPLT